jgi:UDP-N-acetylmuramyl pentapeptide phosphotransferase/UDP-N-acetylglucosamine-1-phosphate transferase
VYVLLLTEIGVIGTGILFFLVTKIAILWYRRKDDRDVRLFSIVMIQLLFLGLFDHYLLTSQQGRLFSAILLGLFLSKLIRKEKSLSV